jgi:intracellular multiplication protein IcmJ
MARPPLVLSAHPSAWTAEAVPGGRKAGASAPASCQFCGQPTAGWQVPYHLNDDHADESAGNVVISCPLCHLPQHLNRPQIDREAVLVWLPEMAQGAVNVLARHIHLACTAAGYPPFEAQSARPPATRALAGYHAYRALYERRTAAELRLGTTSPRHLGAALLDLSAADYARRAVLLGGIRLLPTGRLYEDGHDIYPEMLRDWTPPRAAPPPAPSPAAP